MVRLSKLVKKPRVFIPLSITVIIFSVFFFYPVVVLNSNIDNVLGVKLLSVSPVPIQLDGTTCYIKTTGTAIKGSLLNIQQSAMLTKHPSTSWGQTLSLVDINGVRDPITTFNITPKIRCDSTPNQTFILDSSDLKFQVLSQNKKLDKVQTYLKTLKTTNDILLKDNTEAEITTVAIKAEDIEANIPDKEFNSYQEFRTSGKLVIYYQNYPDTKYTIDIPDDSIRVYYNTLVTANPATVPRQNTGCPTGQILVDNSCVVKDVPQTPSPTPTPNPTNNPNQEDPKVSQLADIQSLLSDWFTKFVLGDFKSLSDPKFMGINVIAGLLIFVAIVSAVKPKKKVIQ